MKKLFLIVGFLLISTTNTIRAQTPTILSQVIKGAAIGTSTGISFGLVNKYYPHYRFPFLLIGLAHSTLVREAHQRDAGIMLDTSAMVMLVTWFIALNKSQFCETTSTDCP